jgi:hypothetical protein
MGAKIEVSLMERLCKKCGATILSKQCQSYACKKPYLMKYYQKNKDKHNARSRKWAKEHPERIALHKKRHIIKRAMDK